MLLARVELNAKPLRKPGLLLFTPFLSIVHEAVFSMYCMVDITWCDTLDQVPVQNRLAQRCRIVISPEEIYGQQRD